MTVKPFSFFKVPLLIAVALPAAASEQTGAAFLKMGVGARADGLNSAYTALANDPSALYWNPGGLASLSRQELLASRRSQFSDVNLDFIGYARPLNWGGLGAGITRLSQEPLQGRDDRRGTTGTFQASDSAAVVSAARRLTDGVGAGVSVKMIRQQIGQDTAQGLALDAGLMVRTSEHGWRLGLALQNAGPSMKFGEEAFQLPLALNAGLSAPLSDFGLVSVEAKQLFHENKTVFGAGFELSPYSFVSLRAGYSTFLARGVKGESTQGNEERYAGFGWGVGLKRGRYGLDYAFTPTGDLGDSQQFTFHLGF
jgi:hypothetical protein